MLAEAKSMRRERQIGVQAYFTDVTDDATPTTVAGYVGHIMNMCALLNVANFRDILVNPSDHRIELHRKCNNPYTESTYITALLSVFKYNPTLKEQYPQHMRHGRMPPQSTELGISGPQDKTHL